MPTRKTKILIDGLHHPIPPISMYEALSTFENDPKGFTVEELKAKAGIMWDQKLWNWLAKESFDLDNETQSPRLPHFDQSLGRWLYIP